MLNPTCAVIRAINNGKSYELLEYGDLPSLNPVNTTLIKMYGTNMLTASIKHFDPARKKSVSLPIEFHDSTDDDDPPNIDKFISAPTALGTLFLTIDGNWVCPLGEADNIWFARPNSLLKSIEKLGVVTMTVRFDSQASYKRFERYYKGIVNETVSVTEEQPTQNSFIKEVTVKIAGEAKFFYSQLISDIEEIRSLYGSDVYLIMGE